MIQVVTFYPHFFMHNFYLCALTELVVNTQKFSDMDMGLSSFFFNIF